MAIRSVFIACLLAVGVCNAGTIGTVPIPPDFTLSRVLKNGLRQNSTFFLFLLPEA
jgi:hypothetical protein